MPNILNKTPMPLIPTKGTEAQILDPIVNWYQRPGMLFYSTDTEKLFVSNGTDTKQSNGGSDIIKVASTETYMYCGFAPYGSGLADEVWFIMRTTKADSTLAMAYDVAWDDRASASYS